jgi:hypothetical protein
MPINRQFSMPLDKQRAAQPSRQRTHQRLDRSTRDQLPQTNLKPRPTRRQTTTGPQPPHCNTHHDGNRQRHEHNEYRKRMMRKRRASPPHRPARLVRQPLDRTRVTSSKGIWMMTSHMGGLLSTTQRSNSGAKPISQPREPLACIPSHRGRTPFAPPQISTGPKGVSRLILRGQIPTKRATVTPTQQKPTSAPHVKASAFTSPASPLHHAGDPAKRATHWRTQGPQPCTHIRTQLHSCRHFATSLLVRPPSRHQPSEAH